MVEQVASRITPISRDPLGAKERNRNLAVRSAGKPAVEGLEHQPQAAPAWIRWKVPGSEPAVTMNVLEACKQRALSVSVGPRWQRLDQKVNRLQDTGAGNRQLQRVGAITKQQMLSPVGRQQQRDTAWTLGESKYV